MQLFKSKTMKKSSEYAIAAPKRYLDMLTLEIFMIKFLSSNLAHF
jgi:hypothetical protein